MFKHKPIMMSLKGNAKYSWSSSMCFREPCQFQNHLKFDIAPRRHTLGIGEAAMTCPWAACVIQTS